MAFPPKLHFSTSLISLFFFFLSCSSTDVHDLLPLYNLPKGLLPKDIKSYSLSNTDNSFTIELNSNPCYIKFGDQLVFYDKIIKGKLSYGQVTGASGIQAKKLFVWVSVTGIEMDPSSEMIEFHVGVLSEKLPAKDFEYIHSCKAKGVRFQRAFMEMEALI